MQDEVPPLGALDALPVEVRMKLWDRIPASSRRRARSVCSALRDEIDGLRTSLVARAPTAPCDRAMLVAGMPALFRRSTAVKALTVKPDMYRYLDRSTVPSAAGALALAPALRELTGLQHLDLSNNHIGGHRIGRHHMGARAGRALAPALSELKDLKWLNLRSNDLGPEGVRALAPALAGLTRLEVLHLCSNDLGTDGVRALPPALQ